MSNAYHNDDLDDIGYDVKGKPDAFPAVFVVLCIVVGWGGYFLFGRIMHLPHVPPAQSQQVEHIQRQLSQLQAEVAALKLQCPN